MGGERLRDAETADELREQRGEVGQGGSGAGDELGAGLITGRASGSAIGPMSGLDMEPTEGSDEGQPEPTA